MFYIPKGCLKHAESREFPQTNVRVQHTPEDHSQHVGQMGELNQITAELGTGKQEHHSHQHTARCQMLWENGVGERPAQQENEVDSKWC